MKTITKAAHAVILAASLFAAACSQGDDLDSAATGGQVTVAMTDAASNEIAVFEVDVTGIQMQRLGGANVTVLSTPVRVDLASLADTSLLLASARVPVGTYTSATFTIDFTNARCLLPGQTAPAAILDPNGTAIGGTLSVPMLLDTPFPVLATAHRLLEFDFDLDQSFRVDALANSVALEPAFLLRVDPPAARAIVSVGTLISVDTASSSFVGAVRGLHAVVVTNIAFQASGATVFQIDGTILTGAAGITALAALPLDTSIQCYGLPAPTSGMMNVFYVEVGTGTLFGGTDVIEGHVVGRTGGLGSDAVLEVFGHSTDAAHTAFLYGTTFLVDTSFVDTKVVRRADVDPFDVDDLNVGQFVRVFGTLSGTTMSANTATSVIRMQPTPVFGLAAGAPAGTTLTLDVERVGQLPETAFDWADDAFTPADPNAFTADIGALGVGLDINLTSFVTATGYFTAIGVATPDLTATALENQSTAATLMLVRNRPSIGSNLLVTANAAQIQLNVAGPAVAGEFALIDRGFIGSIPLPSAPTPTINHPTMNGSYSLRDRTNLTVRVFSRFSDFASALQSDIVMGAVLVQFGAVGVYTQNINSLDASIATAVVQ